MSDIIEDLNWGSYNGIRTFAAYTEWAKDEFPDQDAYPPEWFYNAVIFTMATMLQFEEDMGYSDLEGWEETFFEDLDIARKYLKSYLDRANSKELN